MCGFYGPNSVYAEPPVSTLTYSRADQAYAGEINSSFGMDFVDVVLDPAADRQPVTLEFHSATGVDMVSLIITRVDGSESSDPVGEYTILPHAGADGE